VADGSRSMDKSIWSAQVLQGSVESAHFCMATITGRPGYSMQQESKEADGKRQHAEKASCQIYGMEEENGYHVVVRCTKASVLRHEMIKS
jgi:hypothetical protein